MVQPAKILVLEGDGIGPEVMREALAVLDLLCSMRPDRLSISLTFADLGGKALDSIGAPVSKETVELAKQVDAVLLGSVGGPQWEKTQDGTLRPEWGILTLRKELQAFANIRPCRIPSPSLLDSGPLKADVVKGVDFIVLRENAGGIYYGRRKEDDGRYAEDVCGYSVPEIERMVHQAVALAKTYTPTAAVHSVDKQNVMASSRLWRRVVSETMARDYPDVALDHHLVDAVAALMIKNPRALNGVVVTENLFGDILSDLSAVIPGSLGLLPSAELTNAKNACGGVRGIFQPVHGSAPDIAGRGYANPIAMILSVAMMLRHGLDRPDLALAVERAVQEVLEAAGLRTRDIGGVSSTAEMGEAIRASLAQHLSRK